MNGSDKFLPLLAAMHTLLRDFPIQAALASIELDVETIDRPVITVQLTAGPLTRVAAGIIEWDRTLACPRRSAMRTAGGASVFLEVCGQLGEDEIEAEVEVWGEVSFDPLLIGHDLYPGERKPLPIEVLAGWAVGDGRVTP